MIFSTDIITSSEAFELLKQESFIISWAQLAEKDNKVTVIQEYPFVITWYNQYKSHYDPILCLGYSKAKELVGFMPLAKNLKNGIITHAGAQQAEYHGWISHPEIDEDFPIACLKEIKRRFDPKCWEWRWMPPGAPINWLSSKLLSEEGIYVKFRTQDSPLWDLENEAKFQKLIKEKSTRIKLNRYRKKGKFYIERIKDKTRTEELMKILEIQYDFRQEIVFGATPFQNDINKARFHIQMQNYPEANHFTVLWSNNKPLAFNFGPCNKKTLLVGLIGFDPVENKNSPAALLLLELAKMAKEEGYRYIDLTPGSDEYKERFANTYQPLVLPKFFFRRKYFLKDAIFLNLRRVVNKIIDSIGIERNQVRKIYHNVTGLFNFIKRGSLRDILNRILNLLYEKNNYLCYRLVWNDNKMNSLLENGDISCQRYEDLFRYTGSNPWLKKRDLFKEAFRRFAWGEILYTAIKDGALAQCGWKTDNEKFKDVHIKFSFPKGSVILYSFYTNPSFHNYNPFERSIKKMISDIPISGEKEIYLIINSESYASRTEIKEIGFSHFCTFKHIRFLWSEKKWQVNHDESVI